VASTPSPGRGPRVLERVEQLIALASSPNENEARNAALLAVQLIKKHRLVVALPRTKSDPAAISRGEPEQRPPPPRNPSPPPRRRSSNKSVKRVVDLPDKIVAPLGGECIQCGGRYRAEQTILWFSSGGGLHVKCFEAWSKKHHST
jgi:hypothetical protein